MKNLILLSLALIVFGSCQQAKDKFSKTEAQFESGAPALQEDKAFSPPDLADQQDGNANASFETEAPLNKNIKGQDIEKKIIKEGEITFKSNDIKNTRQVISSAVIKLGGYISEEIESGYEGNRKNYTMRLRVPAKNFDALLESVSSVATQIDSKNIRIEDITTEYIDTETRLKNKKILEQRYFDLLRKAVKISDMLSIEDKLTEIRSEIESVEGQLKYMSKQVAYSSLTLTFYTESINPETGKGFIYDLKNAITSGWRFLTGIFFGLISVWPLFIVIGALIWFLRYKRNKQ